MSIPPGGKTTLKVCNFVEFVSLVIVKFSSLRIECTLVVYVCCYLKDDVIS